MVFHWYSYNKGYYYILSAYVWVHARLGRRWQRIISGWNHDTRLSVCHVHTWFPTHNALLSDSKGYRVIERFHSRDQYLCKFMRTKESVYIRKARVELLPQNLFGTPIWPIWPDDHTRYNELTLQTTSRDYFYRKRIGTANGNLNFDIRA